MNHENAKKLLFDLDDVLNLLNIPYMLYAGTLLGAVRENDFISVDLDLDIAIMEENFNWAKILTTLECAGFKCEVIDHRHTRHWDGTVYAIKCKKYGERCDIVCLLKLGDKRYNPSHIDDPIFVHTEKYCYPWKKITMFGREFNIPEEYDNWLKEHYGDTWRVPSGVFWSDLRLFGTAKFPKGDDDFWWAE